MKRIMAGLHKFGLKPFIVPAKGENGPQKERTHSLEDPLPTVTASGHLDLVEPFILPQNGSNGPRSVDQPCPVVTTTSRGLGLAEPFLVKLRGTNNAADVKNPVPTITASGTHIALAEPFLVEVAHGNGADKNGDNLRAKSLHEPLPTVCGQRVKYYGTADAASVDAPLNTVTAKHRFGLGQPIIEIEGERYVLDILFRMLQPHELAAAQGFRPGYKFSGNKTEQIKQIGNAVPRRLARAIVAAVLSQGRPS